MAESQGLLSTAGKGFSRLPIMRQVGLLLGLSASIALGFYVVLWSQEPNYRPIYSNLSNNESTEILDALQLSGINYKLDSNKGEILVPANEVYKARLKLASEGLPKSATLSFESMTKEQGFGTSRFMENARFVKALETELVQTITNIHGVKNARVHIAIPKESVFISDKRQPTASVLVDLQAGSHLKPQQVAAIAQLVAASVTNMKAKDVAVVDQQGNLLSATGLHDKLGKTKDEFDYTRNLENTYANRIEAILTPLLGPGKIKAKVSAKMDFTSHEQTQESFNPNSQALRSEKIFDETNSKNNQAVGVPGALTNTPPATANDQPQQLAGEQGQQLQGNQGADNLNVPHRKEAMRRYEVGKTISHLQSPVGKLENLSVAVVVDDHVKVDPDSGEVTRTPLTEEELNKITQLVENTIGYDQNRGDKLSVVNIPFVEAAALEPLPTLPIWQQAWFWTIVKISSAGLFILMLVFLVLRPTLKNLASKSTAVTDSNLNHNNLPANIPANVPQVMGQQMQALAADGMQPKADMNTVKQMVSEDPMKIAQVMKTWVGDE